MLIELIMFAAYATGQCTAEQRAMGMCPSVTNTGSTIELGASRPGGGDTDGTRAGPDRRDEAALPPAPPVCTDALGRCNRYEVVLLRPTLEDVASFAPTSHPLVDEPDGVGIVGMPVNFVVDADTHTDAGVRPGEGRARMPQRHGGAERESRAKTECT